MSMFNQEALLNKIYAAALPEKNDLVQALAVEDSDTLSVLYDYADRIRQQFCGGGILLRGIIEFSSFCDKSCFYCGLNKNNHRLSRYRMKDDELFNSVRQLSDCQMKTVVLQSGEDPALDAAWLAGIIRRVKKEFDLAVTLCVGERKPDDYRMWKDAGADRYLLKIETTDEVLYNSIHPGMSFKQRLGCLEVLRKIGYQVGCGNIIGLPGQTLESIAGDILFFKQQDFDMIGIGPFIPHPESKFHDQPKGQVQLTLKMLALTRIVTRNAHLPATTALGSLKEDYRMQGLKCGANVLMPNFTPQPYRPLYQIYPGKKCVDEPVGACNFCMDQMAQDINRFIDYAKGDSLKLRKAVF